MWRGLILAMAILPGAALACPDYDLAARENYHVQAEWMREPLGFYVIAGGRFNLADCPDVTLADEAPGFFEDGPDFSFQLSGLAGRRLILSVRSECDAALLINTASGSWLYDDDGNPESEGDPRIVLTRPADGRLDLWVGSHEAQGCRARLTLQAR